MHIADCIIFADEVLHYDTFYTETTRLKFVLLNMSNDDTKHISVAKYKRTYQPTFYYIICVHIYIYTVTATHI